MVMGKLGLDQNTVENILILLGSILLFQGISNIPAVGKDIFPKYYWLVIIAAVFIFRYAKSWSQRLTGRRR